MHKGKSTLQVRENKGVNQLVEYIDYCSKYQGKLRDEFKFKDFREPNGILILGTEKNEILRQPGIG